MFQNYLPRVNKKNENNSASRMQVENPKKKIISYPIFSMNMEFMKSTTSPSNNISLSEAVSDTTQNTRDMPWAQPTWYLLHTLAEKVYEQHFSEIRVGLLNTIYAIVTLLPCPICAKHGKEFLDGINFNTIVSKDNLKYMLFDFHNLVNNKKHLKTFLYPDLVKYETAITRNVIQKFIMIFARNTGSIRLIADDLHRKRTTVALKKWFNENIDHFSP